MSVLERCKRLREEIVRRDTLLREVKNARVFVERAQEIRDLCATLSGSISQLKILRDHGIPLAPRPATTAAVERLKRYRQQLEANPADSGREHGNTKRALDKVSTDFEAIAKEALNVIQRLPAVEESFLKQVEANPASRTLVAGIRSAREELRRALNRAFTADTLPAFLKQRDDLLALVERLKPEDFPKEVLDFFKAAQHGAPLEKFTETVRHWLASRNQLSNVRLYIMEQ